jgi:hypothetical protein
VEDFSVFIESRLVNVDFNEDEKSVAIGLILGSKGKAKIVLQGIDIFILSEMRERNIVESILVYDDHADRTEFDSTLSMLISGYPDKNAYDKSFLTVIESAALSIESGQQILVEIRAIFGAQVVALVDSIHCE